MKKQFARYVSLNIIGMLGVSCYILVDTFFVSHVMGADGLAALNFAIAFFSIMSAVGLMTGIGGGTDYAVTRESGEPPEQNKALAHSLAMGAMAAGVLVCIGLFLTEPLSRVLGASGRILPMTEVYLKTFLCFSPAFILNNIMLAFVRNDGEPRLSMIAMVVSSLSNILLDYIFMYPLALGMFGAALATCFSPVISLAILSRHYFSGRQNFRLVRCRISLKRMLKIAGLGFSSMVGELASAVTLWVFNLTILGLTGNIGVAAFGIVANIEIVEMEMFFGIAQGLQPLASSSYGRNDRKSVRQVLIYALVTAEAMAVTLYIIMFILADPVVSIFNSEGSTVLGAMASKGLRLFFTGFFFGGVNIVAAAFLSSVTEVGKSMAMALMRSCIILVPTVLIMSRLFGMTGVWLSFTVTEAIVALVTLIFIKDVFSCRGTTVYNPEKM